MPIHLSGSLVITGSITTTGVITMSGSIASASYSSTSDLLQGTGSLGFTTTASFNAVSSSQQQISSSQQQISASLLNVIAVYATTGSNSFRATQSITGSLTVTGQIIAQTLNVQQVTSSIIYSSGSNNFGCDLNSRQTFTGSVNITGSQTVFGNLGIGTNNPTYKLEISGSSGTFSFNPNQASAMIIRGSVTGNFDINNEGASGCMRLYGTSIQLRTAAVDPALTIASTGAATFVCSVTGTTIYGSTAVCSPVGKFSTCIDAGSGIFSSSVTAGADITANDTSVGSTFLYLKGNATTGVTGVRFARANTGAQMGKIDYDFGTDLMTFRAGGNDRMYLTSGGCLLINCNTTSATGILTVGGDNNQIHVRGGYYASIYGFSGAQQVFGLYGNCDATYLNARGASGLYLGGQTSCNHIYLDTNGITCFFNTVCAKSGVKFGSGSCCLNYYEEGKWCIYACGSTSGAGPVGEGTYTRVGRLVTASILINSQTFPSYSGTLRLSMPFTAGTGSGLGGNMSWNAGGVYFYPFSAWCSGTNFTGIDALVFNSTNYAQLSIGNVNGDRQGAVASSTTATSGAGGLYLRFTITYEVSQ